MLKVPSSSASAAAFATMLSLAAMTPPVTAAPLGGFISEIRGGIFDHDALRDNQSKTKESNTIDINGEILSTPLVISTSSIPFVQSILAPRANIGFTANTSGCTNTGYGGLSWEWGLGSNFFLDFSFGMALQDGQLKAKKDSAGNFITDGRPNLGSPVLFREAFDLGYRFQGVHSVSAFAAHISNAGWLAQQNDGMNFVGMRYGYKFN